MVKCVVYQFLNTIILAVDRDNIHVSKVSMWGIFTCHDANHLLSTADNKAAGTDDLGSVFIKRIGDAIAFPLVLMFKKSLQTTSVPK